ncbi:MAG TPA: polysaccharide biosynthesis/export family protein [Vicinamibacterales bacterium]|jgi:polysaccharide biosynthesis/export protein|nr:polysaccharide biosynthesis/export family protein [Vicinamibacterales bacterium]
MKTATFAALSSLILLSTASAQTPMSGSRTAAPQDHAPTAATVPSLPANTSADYRLQPGDKIHIEVYHDQDLSPSLQIRPDGKITLPLLGDVPAAGRTSLELRDQIAKQLNEYIASPVVTVMVLETVPQVVYVMGEVNKPGTLSLVGGRLSILQALAMAGGFTDFANKKDIRVLRHGKNGMQTLRFNYKEALDDSHEPLQLLPGDTVIVK